MDLSKIKYNEAGLVPAIAQDVQTSEVVMMAWMNEEALRKTLETGQAHYFSRSRQELWHKGATSGHIQEVVSLSYDCDGDALLLKIRQHGNACHTGAYSCFHHPLIELEDGAVMVGRVMHDEMAIIQDRLAHPVEGSYVNYLFDKGIDKMCKKVGEEAAEVIIAAKNRDADELRYEIGDLFFHTLVVMAEQGLTLEEVYREMIGRRRGKEKE